MDWWTKSRTEQKAFVNWSLQITIAATQVQICEMKLICMLMILNYTGSVVALLEEFDQAYD